MADESMIVRVGANINQFQRKMREVGKTILATDAIAKNSRLGTFIAVSPAIVPALAGITGAVASLGPMLGVAAGGVAGLGTAFGAAGAASVGFGAVAIGNLTSVFKASSDLSKAQQEYTKAITDKDRQKALDKEKQAWMGLDSEQKNALKSLQSFKSFWTGFYKSFQSPVLQIFSKGINALQTTLKIAEPAIEEAARAINGLMDSLNASLKTDDIKAFFNWLGTSAGPAITALGQSFGNAMRGIMNLLVAFGPLSTKMQNGLVGMTQAFAKWTSGLSKSSKFQAFISYVETNGPKLLKILGNIGSGLIGVFSAFAPMSANMMTGLVNLTARFKEWGQSLGQTQGFKDFISYVQENGPKLLNLIGQLVTLGGNLLKAFAPFGSVTLDIVNALATFLNTLMGISPAFGYVIVAVIQMIGAIKLLFPIYSMLGAETKKKLAEMAAAWIKARIAQAKAVLGMIKDWIVMGAKSTLNAAKIAGAWLLAFGKNMLTATISMATTVAKTVAGWVLMGVQSLIQAARIAAAWVIAMGPIGWVIAAVIGLVALIVIYWDKIKAVTLKVFGYVWTWLKDQWNQMVTMFKTVVSAISNAISTAWNWIKNTTVAVWNAIKDFFVKHWKLILTIFTGPIGFLVSLIVSNWDKIKNVTSSVWGGIKSFFVGIWDGITSAVKGGINGVIGILNKFIGFMNRLHIKVPKVHIPLVGDVGGFNIGLPQIPKIPSLASGGVASKPTLAMIGDAGLGNPEIVAPEKKLRNIFSEMLAKANGGSSVLQLPDGIRINIGGYEADGFIDFVTEKQDGKKRRYNRQIKGRLT